MSTGKVHNWISIVIVNVIIVGDSGASDIIRAYVSSTPQKFAVSIASAVTAGLMSSFLFAV